MLSALRLVLIEFLNIYFNSN